ncbi:MAG: GHMP kinase [Clostridia bacterium]|nr:GHMP kinase [Clostridia bacterium]
MELFVPGRLCLFGEHSDWASLYQPQNKKIPSGSALVSLLDLGIYARAEKSTHIEINSVINENDMEKKLTLLCAADVSELQVYIDEHHFFSYAASICQYMIRHYHVEGIFLDNYKTTLPIKKGLASSASFSVLLVRAFNRVYHLGLTFDDEREIAFLCENISHSRCGRMDHACAYPKSIMHLAFNHGRTVYSNIEMAKDIYLVIVDLNGVKNTRVILDNLNSHYPFPRNRKERGFHRYLGKYNIRTIEKAASFLKKGKVKQLGHLMNKVQKQFDRHVQPFSEEDLSSPLLHSLLNDKSIYPFIYGGKGVGSHGDGCAQLIARDGEKQLLLVSYLISKGYRCYPVMIKKEIHL